MTEIFQDCMSNLEDTDPARKAVQKLLIHTCGERDFSSQEVLHMATGKKLVSSSRSFVKITFRNEWVPVGPVDENTSDNEVR